MSFGLDGVIVLDPLPEDPRWDALQGSTSPVVLLGRDPHRTLGPSVVPDTDQGMQALLDHLWEQGVRSLGLIAPDIAWAEGQQAIRAAASWCEAKGITPMVARAQVSQCVTREAAAAAGRATAQDVLASANRPDALVGLLEDFGRGIVSAARSRGLSVPGDLLVAQDVDGLLAQVADPPITAIDLNIAGQITAAVTLLVADDEDRVASSTVQTVSVNLVVRDSTLAR
jgi:DNA-binding LacI/PurR family transcriptional regulator